MTATGNEEEEMDLRPLSCLPPPAGIATPLMTTQHCDDQPVHSATNTNMADTLCSPETNMDTKIQVTLVNDSVWQEFHSIGTEMLLTRQGRRMFPFCRYRITGMNPHLLYVLIMDFHLMDEYRYRWTVGGRLPGGPSEVHESRGRVYTHPSSPRQGAVWMDNPVVFGTVKLTSDLLNDDGLVVLHSNHRYIPRLHIVPFDPNEKNTVSLDNSKTQTFMFPQTEFYAVSCYQNPRLIKLKIKHNPFARQFQDEEVLKQRKDTQITPRKPSVSSSSESKHTKKWAKKRSSLPAAAELGFGASPVLKKKMNSSGLSSQDDSFSLAGGLTCTEEMLATDDSSSSSIESGERPLNARLATPCLKKQVPANLKLKATTATKASTRTFTSTPRVMKRPRQFPPKTPKMPLCKSRAWKNAKGHGNLLRTPPSAVMETPSEPGKETPELAVDDVEGMLFVSFPSKESHDSHVPLKRQPVPLPAQPPLSPPPPPPKCPPALQVLEATRATEPEEVTGGLGVLQNTIVRLEKVLLLDLGSVKHRQVIHPALQHVGLKLNLVDPEVAIDLQYLGVNLPLPPFPQSSADGTIPFVSRTGKTNDLTKIKGWRDKYSCSSDLPHAPPQERAVKVSSAFSSDLLDEYLESEAQSIAERAETFSCGSTDAAAAPGSTGGASVAYSLPSRGSSYVRTLDSVLKRQATATSTDSPSLSSANTAHESPSLTSIRPRGAAYSQTWTPGTNRTKLSPTTQLVPVYPYKHTPRPGVMSPVVPQMRITAPLAPRLPSSGKVQLKRYNLGVSRYVGVTTPQGHLQAMERHAFCRGHADTYITTERATIALGVLLTAEGSLKADRVQWTSEDMPGPCQQDFCRLGCVCLSLDREPRGPTHCQRPQCMFECVCFRHRVLLVRPHPDSNGNSRTQKVRKEHTVETTDLKILAYPIADADNGLRPAPGQRVHLLWQGRTDDKDPEPMFRPERKCMYEFRASLLVTSKAPTKPPPKVGGRRAEEVQKDSPVYMYFDSMMTCARVRPINSMPPPQVHILPAQVTNKAKDNTKQSPETPLSKLNTVPSQKSVLVAQKPEEMESAQTTRMLEIVSECNWEPHRELVLGALQRRLKLNLLVPSFTLGYYQVCLLSATQQKSQNHTTITYKLSISRKESDTNASGASEKEKPLKKAPPPRPSLPGYLKARKLGCGVSPRRLIEVNGKQYAKAKLMLGQMGALQPASRLAAFVTGRLITLPQMEVGGRFKASLNKTSEAIKCDTPGAIKTSEPLSSTGTSSTTPEASVVKSAVPGPLAASQLLYIPIGSPDGAMPSAPMNLDPVTQKVMLKPVANTQKGALYRQPNGQLVQLVPLKPLKAIIPKPAPGSALGAESDLPTPSGSGPENDPSPSSACQDGNTDRDIPDSSTSVAKPFSLSGKSTMCISQGSTAVRSLPGIGIFSFRICPPTEMAKMLGPDSQVDKDDQKTSPSLSLPGGFTLIQLPQVSIRKMKTSGVSAETEATAALSQASDQSQGSQTARMSNVGAQIDRTSVKENKIIAPVVVPPMVLRPPQFKRASLRTSQQCSDIPLASNTSHRTSQQGSGTSLASDASQKISQQGSGTPKANAKAIDRKTIRVRDRIQGPKMVSSLSGILTATSVKERHQRTILDMGFRKLKEVLHMSNLKVTQQDILDQARLIICALQRREKILEEKKTSMSDMQSDYIRTISQLSGKPEEMIRKKLKETSNRQRLLEQYRQRKPDQVQLTPKECDWLTERFAIWKRHARKSRRKVLALSPPLSTGEELAGTPQSSWHSDGKARDSPELRAALLTPGNNVALGSSSGEQRSMPSLGLDVNKVISLLKRKSLPPQDNQSGEPVKLLHIPDLKIIDKPSENIDKSHCLDVNGSDHRSESVVEDARNISPSGLVNASSSQQKHDRQPRVVVELESEVEEQPCSDAALATDTAEQQHVDEEASADPTSPPEKSSKNTKKRNALLPPAVENTAPKRKRGRPPKQAAAAQPKAKTAPPVPQKVKHSARLQARQLRSHSSVSTRTHPGRGKQRGWR